MSHDERPPQTVEEVTQRIKEKTGELLSAPPQHIPALTLELQKLRIAAMVLRETENGVSDPNTYKELTLLNRLMTGRDLETEAERQAAAAETDEAEKVLERKGISPESARRILRVLSVIAPPSTGLSDEEPPEPDDEPSSPDESQ